MDNWHTIRGSKLQCNSTISKQIDFVRIHKKILMIVDLQMKHIHLDIEDFILPNNYGHWIVK